MDFLNRPWVRPSLFVLTGVAALVKMFTPDHTIAHKVADQVLLAASPLAAASVGQTNKK